MFYYEQGDYILLKHIPFLDDNSIDVKTSMRPFLVISDFNFTDDHCYLLKMSTDKRFKDDDNHFEIRPTRNNKLKRVSYIDLRYIYQSDNNNAKIAGHIPEALLDTIIKKLKNVQEKCECQTFIDWKENKNIV
ncbi:hypothetical protein CYJ57_02980 [Falseniella ignava]|uniref:PemK-like protein n=1 Tax=Falseniella ignava TaxID=137730 RepID=A0A2I1K222_9LACT|nr:type II toxin-antitoxin system PemK/MazF family toxin [Falseniella ignava]PKY89688.1 hypothetical protein CYJ57_02980 [Falseniella ignava]